MAPLSLFFPFRELFHLQQRDIDKINRERPAKSELVSNHQSDPLVVQKPVEFLL